ncbi:hypothetical protein LO80_05065 [Candidatus Francisella endociliophora]|uniref:Transmembrane protein (PGPGW) n=1 Tax=Candidatus Francisella endociliophora TaxID=653937 RepID=A0A097EPA4_9GAMM|nr:hypothetical protein [Francisella sp. FSC1006]AIT09395.1 hypothetical protein LO80_05065 [Francisella sp. FSC1006]
MFRITKFVKLKSGKRFYCLHKYFRRRLSNPLILIVLLAFSGVSLFAGFIMLFIPGPGLLFIGLSFLPVIAVSKRFAKFLDRVEITFKQKIQKFKVQKDKTNKKK